MSSDPLKTAKDAASFVGDVLRAAGENPQARAAGGELGRTALTITKTINNALLPLAAVNFAFDRARTYFSDRFSSELGAKASKIPVDQIIDPKGSIAGPALQGLAFAHEEPDLKDMYLSLLATAMDARLASKTHPAFVEIIRQLSAEEAQLLRLVLSVQNLAVVEIRLWGGGGFVRLLSHLLDLRSGDRTVRLENSRLPAFVDNWIRLGLVSVDYDKHLVGADMYEWVDHRPEMIAFKKERETDKNSVVVQRGALMRTSLGEQFASVVGILTPLESSPKPPE